MKQILQDMSNGATTIAEAPVPSVKKGCLLINTNVSLISSGTERMLVDFGKGSLVAKARQQPEKVKMVLNKAKTDGFLATFDAVKSKLYQPIPLGYCNVGIVAELGYGVQGFNVGDRVLSNGSHADVVRIPKNLCAKIPSSVSDESAVFTVVASIGLQGIRLAAPVLGECVVVTGVGLIGLLTVQLLIAQGCRVLAVDYDQKKLDLAKTFGAEICNPGIGQDPVSAGMAFSRGNGVDAVIIAASTHNSDPVTQAAQMSRKRGRIILVGVTGLALNRADFYEKELSFQVSCSYGPGRYDARYEEQGFDYPLPFIRWTEQRNFEAVLDMMAAKKIDTASLISHSFLFEDSSSAYRVLTEDSTALGILLKYTSEPSTRHAGSIKLDNRPVVSSKPVIGFIGGGNYASRTLIPAFKKAGGQLHTISTSGGLNSVVHGEKAGFFVATTDTPGLIQSNTINALVIVTQHNSHASFVVNGLKAGKNIFVEKPLALTMAELESVEHAYNNASSKLCLMVGFNRRFSPHVRKMKQLLESVAQPKSLIITVNAGAIESDHWTQDVDVGGGRIIGEACHFIDLMRFLVGHEIVSVQSRRMGDNLNEMVTEDKASICIGFSDGSFGTIHYLANGSASFPKERVEVFTAGRVLQLDNFRKLQGYGWPGFRKMNLWQQDKGQLQCCKAFLAAIENGQEMIWPAEEIFEVTRATIDAASQLRQQ